MATKKGGSLKKTDTVLITSASLTAEVTGILGVANGGTGQSTFTDGQLLIGNTTGNTLTKATLTQGTGVTITNGSGSITIAIGQAVATTDTPQFARLGIGSAADATHKLLITGGTITSDAHLLDSTVTWNASGVVFTAWKLNVTNTASSSGSLLLDLQVGAVSKFSVDKGGTVSCVAFNALSFASVGGDSVLTQTAPSIVTSATVTRSAIGTTSSDGLVLTNASSAAAGAQQYSPRLRLTGQGWKTNATATSQTVDWIVENQPVQGAANPSTNLVCSSQVNAGGYTSRMVLTSGGNLGVGVSAPADSLELSGAIRVGTGSFVSGVGRMYVTASQGLVITAGTGSSYDFLFANRSGGTVMRLTANSSLFEFNTAGDTIISGNNGAIATNATEGFIYIPRCAGAPTGTPANAGLPYTPMVYDTTNNKIWFYNGSWRGVAVT